MPRDSGCIDGCIVRRAHLAVALVMLAACSRTGEPDRPPAPAPSPGRPAELPVARTEVSGAEWLGRIVVVGGLTADGAASDRVDLYDPGADRWESGPALPRALHHGGLAVVGERVYVAGGYTNEGGRWVAQTRASSLGPGERAWRDEPAMGQARGGLALAATDSHLVAIGGTTPASVTRTTEVLMPGRPGGWRPGPDLSQDRDHLGGASVGGRVYAVAGRVGGLDTNLATVESWDPAAGGGWRAEPRLNDARGGTSATQAGGKVCVAGGEEPVGTIASVECLVGDRWERVARLALPRHGLAVGGLDGRVHVIGGGPQPGLFVSPAHEVFSVAHGINTRDTP